MINNKVMNNSYIILYNNFLSFNSDAKVKLIYLKEFNFHLKVF